ncbi:MAG: hypothetical protein RBR67_19820 [Desulfobacterium sp.]|nr:hypothetical protein [Desulfobacterium sp.]
MLEQSLFYRTKKIILALSITFAFVYCLLSFLTNSIGILNRMSLFLEETEIDPTSYRLELFLLRT